MVFSSTTLKHSLKQEINTLVSQVEEKGEKKKIKIKIVQLLSIVHKLAYL
jgi:hypothetical protein